MIERIISGGQTGADRHALDFAIEHGIPHGGWANDNLLRVVKQITGFSRMSTTEDKAPSRHNWWQTCAQQGHPWADGSTLNWRRLPVEGDADQRQAARYRVRKYGEGQGQRRPLFSV